MLQNDTCNSPFAKLFHLKLSTIFCFIRFISLLIVIGTVFAVFLPFPVITFVIKSLRPTMLQFPTSRTPSHFLPQSRDERKAPSADPLTRTTVERVSNVKIKLKIAPPSNSRTRFFSSREQREREREREKKK